MTPDADAFLDELRAQWNSGSGPDAGQLIALWKPREPERLRHVLDELARHGAITFNRSIATPDPERSRYGMTGIVGVTLR
jgi:hypothetical protein